MKQRNLLQLAAAAFGLIVVLLSSCDNSETKATQSRVIEAGNIVTSLPSISELAGTPALEIQPLPTFSSEEIALGEKVYADNCAECHGENLEGEENWQIQNQDGSFRAPPHDDTGHTWHHGDSVLTEAIELGGARLTENIGGFSEMPAYEDTLTEEEIMAVLNFIKSSWPEDIRSIQWEQTVREPIE